jgi:hypothetical protein
LIPAYSGLLASLRAATGHILLTIIGQSNAIASGVTAVAPPVGTGSPANTFIWDKNVNAFVAYVAGTTSDPHTNTPGWGSEVGFVKSLRDAGDTRPVYIHKVAVGGTALAVGWQTSGGTQYNAWVSQRATMRAALPGGPRQEVVNICQGEADCIPPRDTEYEANMNALISAARALDADAAAAMWVVERIRPYTGDTVGFPLTSAYRVRVAQEAARSNVRVASLDFDPSNFALIHPGQTWVYGKGQAVYQAWANGVVVNDTTPTNLGSITDVTGATAGSTITSNEITIAGIDRTATVTISGGEYRVRNSDDSEWQAWTSSAGTIQPFQKLALRAGASASPSTTVNVTVTVGGVSESWSVTTAAAALTISGTPGVGTVGTAYSFTPTVAGGTPGYTFAVISGVLPPGLSINSATGTVSGTPTVATSGGVTIRVTDSLGATADLVGASFVINPAVTALAWDASLVANSPPQLTFTASNVTVSTNANTAGARFARTPASTGESSGKHYFRCEFSGTTGARGYGVGTTQTGTNNGVVGGTINTQRWWWTGTTAATNSGTVGMGSNVSNVNAQYECAVDLDSNLIWFRVVGGLWNNSASANPTTGAGGFSISGRSTAAVHPMCGLPNVTTTSSCTLVSGTPPAGFTQWV